MRVLVTGAAGFIGAAVSRALLARGDEVIGVDDLNPYYDPSLKEARLATLTPNLRFQFLRGSIVDREVVEAAFGRSPDRVVHLAAQAGVRYSIENPYAYIDTNVTGTLNVLEGCRHNGIEHLVFASSSSVYGANTRMPFSVHDNVDHPVSLYAATKKSNELIAHTYSHLFGIPVTGLRFFTVYGPWGRPDMALFKFTKAVIDGERLEVYGGGQMQRDFTYIDDIVEGVVRVLDRVPSGDPSWSGDRPDPATSSAPYRLYNIGNNSPVALLDFIGAIQKAVGRRANLTLLPMQPGDVPATFADIDDLVRDVEFTPSTPLDDGVGAFVDWYRSYYGA